MQKFMKWMNEVVGPKADKLAQNAWIAGVKQSIDKVLPMILVESDPCFHPYYNKPL